VSEKVLVTGATGFLGRHLTHDLVKKGYDVTVLARPTSHLAELKTLNIKVFHGDITNRLSLLQACEDKDYVYHLAGHIAYKSSERPLMEKINVEGTANVIDACITHNTKKLLHLSSVVAVGANFKPEPINEDFEFNLSQYNLGYFETKRRAEQMIVKAHHENGLAAYMINPSTIYGAGDGTKGSRKTQIKVAQGRFRFYPPGGVNVVHVDDVIAAIHLALEKGQPARRYIIAGENLLLRDLFFMIADIAQVKRPQWPIPRFMLSFLGATGDLMRSMGKETSLSSETAVTASLYHWFSNQRAKDELGFQPRPAYEAVQESIVWMRDNGLLA
jgi:dihydroflavonol-4-reductase